MSPCDLACKILPIPASLYIQRRASQDRGLTRVVCRSHLQNFATYMATLCISSILCRFSLPERENYQRRFTLHSKPTLASSSSFLLDFQMLFAIKPHVLCKANTSSFRVYRGRRRDTRQEIMLPFWHSSPLLSFHPLSPLHFKEAPRRCTHTHACLFFLLSGVSVRLPPPYL